MDRQIWVLKADNTVRPRAKVTIDSL